MFFFQSLEDVGW